MRLVVPVPVCIGVLYAVDSLYYDGTYFNAISKMISHALHNVL
jgi:hypothetical protein